MQLEMTRIAKWRIRKTSDISAMERKTLSEREVSEHFWWRCEKTRMEADPWSRFQEVSHWDTTKTKDSTFYSYRFENLKEVWK